jgi:HNH endonuclease
MEAIVTKLTAERLRALLDYDAETGLFTWRIRLGNARVGDVPRCFQNYYVLQIDKRRYLQHRLAWLWTYGVWPNAQIDHINGDCRDNRLANLRNVSMCMNMQNRAAIKKESGLPMGVTRNNVGGYNANIRIGTFATVEEARDAYLHAKTLFHPGFTGRK